MREDVARLRQLLAEATAELAPGYFLLPVADAEGGEPIMHYRERVYAYELYHQLRLRWPQDWAYSLAGEIDKRGHPIVRGGILDNAKPDLLVHVPGRMDANLAVVEITALRPDAYPGEDEAFERDIKKLLAFRNIGYVASFFIGFGESPDRVLECGRTLSAAGLPIDLVDFLHHDHAGEPAVAIGWQEG